MKIPNPVAKHGEKVIVENYRATPGTWENGVVVNLGYENRYGKFSWSYDIKLERESKKGNPIFLYVGDDKIRRPHA